MGLDVRLAGGLALEVDGAPVDDSGLGRLGRVALAYLVVERDRPVTRDELAEVLWAASYPDRGRPRPGWSFPRCGPSSRAPGCRPPRP